MADHDANNRGVAPDAKKSPFFTITNGVLDWLGADRRHQVIAALVAALMVTIMGCLWLGTRSAETTTAKVSLIEVTAARGEDLGSIGARFGRSRIEMVGFNVDLIERNTIRCGANENGACRRDHFGERELAFDAIWPGDKVLIVPRGAFDSPALASTP